MLCFLESMQDRGLVHRPLWIMEVIMTIGLVTRVWYITGDTRVWMRRGRKVLSGSYRLTRPRNPMIMMTTIMTMYEFWAFVCWYRRN